jgi:hypothetical protein
MQGNIVNAHPEHHGKAHQYSVDQTFTFVLRHDFPPKMIHKIAHIWAAEDIIAKIARLRKQKMRGKSKFGTSAWKKQKKKPILLPDCIKKEPPENRWLQNVSGKITSCRP